MGNNALNVNSDVFRTADLQITRHGSAWLFTVCAIMGTCCLAVIGHSFTRPAHHRLFHQITAIILFVATIAYFAMGSNLGQVPIPVEFPRGGKVAAAGTREIFYARYIDWFITTPLLLLDLLLTARVPWPNIIAAIFFDEIMVVCGLIGALTRTSYKWGFWTFGFAAFLYVVYVLLFLGRRASSVLGGPVRRTYYSCGVLLIGVWFLYPIAWGCAEGGNVIHPDSEAVFYGILDLIAKPGFSFLLLWGHRNIDFDTLGLHVREIGLPVVREKGRLPAHEHNGVGNGAQVHDTTHNGAHNGVTPATEPTTTTTGPTPMGTHGARAVV